MNRKWMKDLILKRHRQVQSFECCHGYTTPRSWYTENKENTLKELKNWARSNLRSFKELRKDLITWSIKGREISLCGSKKYVNWVQILEKETKTWTFTRESREEKLESCFVFGLWEREEKSEKSWLAGLGIQMWNQI